MILSSFQTRPDYRHHSPPSRNLVPRPNASAKVQDNNTTALLQTQRPHDLRGSRQRPMSPLHSANLKGTNNHHGLTNTLASHLPSQPAIVSAAHAPSLPRSTTAGAMRLRMAVCRRRTVTSDGNNERSHQSSLQSTTPHRARNSRRRQEKATTAATTHIGRQPAAPRSCICSSSADPTFTT